MLSSDILKDSALWKGSLQLWRETIPYTDELQCQAAAQTFFCYILQNPPMLYVTTPTDESEHILLKGCAIYDGPGGNRVRIVFPSAQSEMIVLETMGIKEKIEVLTYLRLSTRVTRVDYFETRRRRMEHPSASPPHFRSISQPHSPQPKALHKVTFKCDDSDEETETKNSTDKEVTIRRSNSEMSPTRTVEYSSGGRRTINHIPQPRFSQVEKLHHAEEKRSPIPRKYRRDKPSVSLAAPSQAQSPRTIMVKTSKESDLAKCDVCQEELRPNYPVVNCFKCHERICLNCKAPTISGTIKNFIGSMMQKINSMESDTSNPCFCKRCGSEEPRFGLSIRDSREDSVDENEEVIPNDYSGKLQAVFYNMLANLDFQKASSDETVSLDLDDVNVEVKVMNPRVFGLIQEIYFETKFSLVKSVCNSGNLRGGPSKGKSASFFYTTHDKRFLLKTMTKAEWLFLKRDFLQSYYNHLATNPNSFLPRFFICFKMRYRGFYRRFVLMNNVFDTELPIHEVFDLKGSTVGREVTQKELEKRGIENVVWKDVDFDRKRYNILLPDSVTLLMLMQIERDVEMLRKHHIIDYSFLLGIHNYSRFSIETLKNLDHLDDWKSEMENSTKTVQTVFEKIIKSNNTSRLFESIAARESLKEPDNDINLCSTFERHRKFFEALTLKKPTSVSPPPISTEVPSSPKRDVGAENPVHFEDIKVPEPFAERNSNGAISKESDFRKGSTFKSQESYISPFRMERGGLCSRDQYGNVHSNHYFFGIIDVLQPYNTRKALETQMRSIQHETDKISCVDPDLYSARFFKRICSMFG